MEFPTLDMQGHPNTARSHDPLAVAVANASLLGVGYLMLGRRWLAVLAELVTVGLVVVLVVAVRAAWLEMVLLVWWVAVIAHGWVLARRPPRRTVRWQRVVALIVTVPVLLAVVLLRIQAAGIGRDVAQARGDGDCTQALTALDSIWLGDRVADAPLTARLDLTARACHQLHAAMALLRTAGTGDIDALKAGFADLAAVLAQLPGHEKMVDTVLNWFLSGQSWTGHCQAADITDWLRHRPATHNALDRSAGVATHAEPGALVGCGDDLMSRQDWAAAQARYQQLLDRFPGNQLTGRAQQGAQRARLAVELANVRSLLQGGTGSTQPAYCATPAPYGDAAPYGKRINAGLIYGNDDYTHQLPSQWRASDPTKAVLVVCAGETQFGPAVRTCTYQSETNPNTVVDVTFHKIKISVKAYELRTGNLVFNASVNIGGRSCPNTFRSEGVPTDRYVEPADSDVRAAFAPLFTP